MYSSPLKVAGYLFQKVSKAAATAVGGGFMLILIGHQTGYLKVNWKQFEKDVNKTKETAVKEVERRYPAIQDAFSRGQDLVKKNVMISSGFAAGFLLGMAM
ncbi:FUN14 domain-containing protein 1-like [Diadema antillarum]|uniref:FUN14 domain-containing protein 1-like n=1 Tax=Diadema antillarum TaxID=105358 RepID=UPI003A8C3CB0